MWHGAKEVLSWFLLTIYPGNEVTSGWPLGVLAFLSGLVPTGSIYEVGDSACLFGVRLYFHCMRCREGHLVMAPSSVQLGVLGTLRRWGSLFYSESRFGWLDPPVLCPGTPAVMEV